jgi:monofunctional biosynthetic peptidoglycan transglycosylase
MKKNSLINRLLKFFLGLLISFLLISVVWVITLRFLPVYYTPLMFIRSVENKTENTKCKIKKDWQPIERISKNMIMAVIASEDNLFMKHNGFSFKDIKKAINHNKKGKRVRGGSTISQQTAKNVFLWPQRSWVRKGFEAYFTVLIEFFWTKQRIMEVYLNIIETGNCIYGVEAASREYFNKSASKLTKTEAALIAVCLPNPRIYNPAHPSSYIIKRKNHIVNLMSKLTPVNFQVKSETKKIANQK